MQKSSFENDKAFDVKRVKTRVIIETSFSKEIRILLNKGQIMKEHKASYPILIHVLEGCINLGVQGIGHQMNQGDIITLEAGVPHDLTAKENAVIRLSLSKLDSGERLAPDSETLKQNA